MNAAANSQGRDNRNCEMAYEVIDSSELAKRWCLPVTWVRDQVRARIADPIPCVRLGKYVRFEWGSQDLEEWWNRRRTGNRNPQRVSRGNLQ